MLLRKQEEVVDRFVVMKCQEESTYLCSDYLLHVPASISTIDPLCRLKMTRWCYQVIDFIKFNRETVSIAMSYIDRFLCSKSPRAQQVIHSRKEYKLAVMTALYMAIKINEEVIMDMNLLTELSRGSYTLEDFKQMETDILFCLNWRVNGPSVLSFVEHLLALMKYEHNKLGDQRNDYQPIHYDRLMQITQFEVELSVGEYKLMTQKPSVIAAAAILNSIDITHNVEARAIYREIMFNLLSLLQVDLSSLFLTQQCLRELRNLSNNSLGLMPFSSSSPIPSTSIQGPSPCFNTNAANNPATNSITNMRNGTTATATNSIANMNANTTVIATGTPLTSTGKRTSSLASQDEQSCMSKQSKYISPICVSKRKL
mmetsp:Transcript_23586/g.27282  ORF Transcript_23586/g.27282 Transcript_23586/m.27282 type:complete len:371 (+) Transcript_23586:94-1206(+)